MGTGVGQVSLSLSLLRESGSSSPPQPGVTLLASVSSPYPTHPFRITTKVQE